MNKTLLCFVVAIFCNTSLYSQSVYIYTGKVTDTTGAAIPFVNVMLKDSAARMVLGFAQTNTLGEYTIKTTKYRRYATLVATSVGYKELRKSFVCNDTILLYTNNIVLHTHIITADEVIVSDRGTPIKTKGDTTTINPDAFTNGSERVVEDVLKKLPGFEIDQATGLIKYNGQPIEKVLIEGDDLFGSQYQLATRSASGSIIDKIQVIDNYNDNRLLRGLKKTNRQVINIQLDESAKNRPYGSVVAEAGLPYLYRANTYLMFLTKPTKLYTLFDINNVGNSNGSITQIVAQQAHNNATDEQMITTPILTGTWTSADLATDADNFNNALMAGGSIIQDIGSNVKLKLHGLYYRDRNTRQRISELSYKTDTINWTINETLHTERKPLSGKGYLEVIWNINDKTIVTYKNLLKHDTEKHNDNYTYNGKQRNNLFSDQQKGIKHSINFSHRFNQRQLIDVQILHLYATQPQQLRLISLHSFGFSPINSTDFAITQTADRQQNIIETQADYYLFHKQNVSTFTLGSVHAHQQLYTHFSMYTASQNEEIIVPTPSNNVLHNATTYFAAVAYQTSIRRMQIKTSAQINYIHTNITYHKQEKLNHWYIIPEPLLSAKLAYKNIKFGASYSFHSEIPQSNSYISSAYVTDYRTMQQSQPTSSNLLRHNATLGFSYTNAYRGEQVYVNAMTNFQPNSYLSDVQIYNDYIYVNQKLILQPQQNNTLNTGIDKVFFPISTALKIHSSLAQTLYSNIVNQSQIRQNKAYNANLSVALRSVFRFPLNAEIGTEYAGNRIHSNLQNTDYVSQNNYINVFFSYKTKLFVTLSNYQYRNNIFQKNIQTYYISNFEATYMVTMNKLQLSLEINNIFNNQYITQNQVSDYFTQQTQYLLQPRYILAGISYTF